MLQRHEGHAAGDNLALRVAQLEDPADTNEASRQNSDDAYVTGQPEQHRCGARVTGSNDPDAFATAVARAVEHRMVAQHWNAPAAQRILPPERPGGVAHRP